jgi:GH18 family chitinase
MRASLLLVALAAFAMRGVCAAPVPAHELLMTFWSDDTTNHPGNPLPGSVGPSGSVLQNAALSRQLDAIDVLAYAFLLVDAAGNVYFRNPAIDLSPGDTHGFCRQNPAACPQADSALGSSFDVFAHLTNRRGTLQKIVSVGGGGAQRSLDDALAHPDVFVRSAVALVHAFGLQGIDLDFEPNTFFGPDQGAQIAQVISGLRKELGDQAFISIELPGDWETLRSFDCPAGSRCRYSLGAASQDAYVSLMGYDFHGPEYAPVTGHHANLYSDPDEPLLAGFYHLSDQQAIEYLTFRQVPVRKILLGFPAYFVAYGGVDAAAGTDGQYQPFDKSRSVAYDLGDVKGRGSYRLAESLLKSGFTAHYVRVNGRLSAVYAYSPSGRQWLSYDDPELVAAKARYVVARHLAGMMMWEIGQDLPLTDPKSLLRSANSALLSARTHSAVTRRDD